MLAPPLPSFFVLQLCNDKHHPVPVGSGAICVEHSFHILAQSIVRLLLLLLLVVVVCTRSGRTTSTFASEL